MNKIAFLLSLILMGLKVQAQHYGTLPLERSIYLQYETDSLYKDHSSVKPYLLNNINRKIYNISNQKQFDKRIPKKLFSDPLIYIIKQHDPSTGNTKQNEKLGKTGYLISINPLLDLQVGRDNLTGRNSWTNTRGLMLDLNLGDNLHLRSSFWESQQLMPQFADSITRSTDFNSFQGIAPGQGRYKPFKKNGIDVGYASSLISWKASPFLTFMAGNDKLFFGNGYRSLLLSDNAPNMPFAGITADFGPIKYQVIYARLTDPGAPQISPNLGFRRKYSTMHYLDWAISKRLNIGLFEAVLWPDLDTAGKRGFDVNYLNPIIFFRSVEYNTGARDNIIVGTNISYKITSKLKAYGQIVLDEFKLSEIRKKTGWWANKYGGQLGLKWLKPFNVKGLHIQFEGNAVRPYTYSHVNRLNSFTQFNQPLAHPLGANFVEALMLVNYAHKRWFLEGRISHARYGADSAQFNFGQNPLKPNGTRLKDFNNAMFQGLSNTLLFSQFTVAYVINPAYNLRAECGFVYRNQSNFNTDQQQFWVFFGIKTALRNLYFDY